MHLEAGHAYRHYFAPCDPTRRTLTLALVKFALLAAEAQGVEGVKVQGVNAGSEGSERKWSKRK